MCNTSDMSARTSTSGTLIAPRHVPVHMRRVWKVLLAEKPVAAGPLYLIATELLLWRKGLARTRYFR